MKNLKNAMIEKKELIVENIIENAINYIANKNYCKKNNLRHVARNSHRCTVSNITQLDNLYNKLSHNIRIGRITETEAVQTVNNF